MATKSIKNVPVERVAIAELEKLMKRLQKDNANSLKAAVYLNHISTPLHGLKLAQADLFGSLEMLRVAEATGDEMAAKLANREVTMYTRRLNKNRDELLHMVEMSQNAFKRKPKQTAV